MLAGRMSGYLWQTGGACCAVGAEHAQRSATLKHGKKAAGHCTAAPASQAGLLASPIVGLVYSWGRFGADEVGPHGRGAACQPRPPATSRLACGGWGVATHAAARAAAAIGLPSQPSSQCTGLSVCDQSAVASSHIWRCRPGAGSKYPSSATRQSMAMTAAHRGAVTCNRPTGEWVRQGAGDRDTCPKLPSFCASHLSR